MSMKMIMMKMMLLLITILTVVCYRACDDGRDECDNLSTKGKERAYRIHTLKHNSKYLAFFCLDDNDGNECPTAEPNCDYFPTKANHERFSLLRH